MAKYFVGGYMIKNGTKLYTVQDTETKEFFAGYDFMGSAEWVDSNVNAAWLELNDAEQIAADLEDSEAPDDQVPQEKQVSRDHKVLVTKYNTHTHCIFQELMWPEQYEVFAKDNPKHLKVISINLIEDKDAFIHDSLNDFTSSRYTRRCSQEQPQALDSHDTLNRG
jgi:hypothetical protein